MSQVCQLLELCSLVIQKQVRLTCRFARTFSILRAQVQPITSGHHTDEKLLLVTKAVRMHSNNGRQRFFLRMFIHVIVSLVGVVCSWSLSQMKVRTASVSFLNHNTKFVQDAVPPLVEVLTALSDMEGCRCRPASAGTPTLSFSARERFPNFQKCSPKLFSLSRRRLQ